MKPQCYPPQRRIALDTARRYSTSKKLACSTWDNIRGAVLLVEAKVGMDMYLLWYSGRSRWRGPKKHSTLEISSWQAVNETKRDTGGKNDLLRIFE